ncbi:MAG: formate/nitrite transporter family protein [Oscillospiraceae bacterium]|nr:formate/nitrite transporter family protein [Oscillospiraceae bacterium]
MRYSKVKHILKKSIAAGVMIGIGAVAKLCCSNQIVGSFLFSIGLFFICNSKMFLFTGKIGYINKTNWSEYPLIWLGNFIGCVISMALIRLSKPEIKDAVSDIMSVKIQKDIASLSILALFCGVLMFLAVDNYNSTFSDNSKLFGVIIVVMVFLLSGFEHSIANMAYSVLYVSNIDDAIQCLRVVAISTIFNALGSITIRNLLKT